MRRNNVQFRVIASLMLFGFGGAVIAMAAPPPQIPRHGVEPSGKVPKNTGAPAPGLAPALTQVSPQVSGPGVTFTCDATIAALGPAGLCASLGAVLSPIYSNTFTNANASIYIEFNSAAGLADSTTGFFNLVPYATFQAALASKSTDAAKAFVPAVEPSIFGTRQVNLTSALAQALGITEADDTAGIGPIAGLTASGDFCTTPGTNGCYNGLVRVNTPANLKSQIDQGYTYRSLGGSTTGTTDNYDFYSVVEHEVDEVLGSASCNVFTAQGTIENVTNCVSAVDLFRYTSTGTRTFNTLPSIAYFSPDGGLTDTQGNLYNTTSPGGDWADFSQSCVFVQDAGACPSSIKAANSFDITTEGPGGTAGPEVAILNAVGYNLITVTKTAQTITFNSIATQVVGTHVALSATASSGLPVSFSSSTPSVCTVSGTTATLVTVGTCTISASQAGNTTFSPAPVVTRSFTVTSGGITTGPGKH